MSTRHTPETPHPYAQELRYERDDMQDEMRAEIEMIEQTPEQEFRTLLDWVLLSCGDIRATTASNNHLLKYLVERLENEAGRCAHLMPKESA